MLALKKSTVLATLGIAVFVVLALYVWPTIYKYDHIKLDTNDYPVRINRLTDKTEFLLLDGWHVSGEQTKPSDTSRQLPSEEVSKLKGQPQIMNYGYLEFYVYNGSNWDVSEITILVEVFDANKIKVISRPYRMTGYVTPQNSSKFLAELEFTLTAGQTWSYSVLSAIGTPPKNN